MKLAVNLPEKPKGSPAEILRDAAEWVNPALLIAWELKERELRVGLDVDYLIANAAVIEQAELQGRHESEDCRLAIRQLMQAEGESASVSPVGF